MSLADISDDVSTGVTYSMFIELDNSRMTKPERKAAHDIVQRHAAALQVQLRMLLGQRMDDMTLQRESTTTGSLIIDLGVQTDE